jgi:hypothetical protein
MPDASSPTGPAVTIHGIVAADFDSWKHHPVTRVWLRFLADYAAELERLQVAEMRTADAPVSDFRQGEFKGRIGTVAEMAEPAFESIVQFYPQPDDADAASAGVGIQETAKGKE